MRMAAAIVLAGMICAPACYAEGLGTLIEAGGNMADIAKEQKTQTQRFTGVRQALAAGAITKGTPKNDIVGSYGAPVIENTDTATGRIKIVYMPATSDFFKGEKIYLFFRDNALDEVVVKE